MMFHKNFPQNRLKIIFFIVFNNKNKYRCKPTLEISVTLQSLGTACGGGGVIRSQGKGQMTHACSANHFSNGICSVNCWHLYFTPKTKPIKKRRLLITTSVSSLISNPFSFMPNPRLSPNLVYCIQSCELQTCFKFSFKNPKVLKLSPKLIEGDKNNYSFPIRIHEGEKNRILVLKLLQFL